ncbi:hypothetical protein O0I10_011973 [Lichtheimia ornata]|uniref:F-box domain-containing protein n=1 Tax=Lichtheimia ornata TaxID=688661 RepID=A0AAD7USK3_9FUNG|nr:uncharacterized protein O0I10_011973 [Lichtheimia ornata]KAJ8652393.1 hypothetical protein O0I10_011973 [Lichtheimia ornata]
MIHSIWNDVCQQPTLTATRPQYTNRVSDSTTQLQQSIQNVLHVLDDRAIVLTLSADSATALRDAAAMREISPLSPLGYLREAAIHSEQGRQQAVIDICNEGLSVVDINDPGYSKLQQAKSDAMQRDNCRIDFISQLPLDVVTHILLPMLMHDADDGTSNPLKLCPYLDVSQTWFDRVLQAGGGAFRFNIYDEDSSNQVTRFAQHTKAACMNYYYQGNWQSEFLRDANLCSLRELKIEDLNQTTNVDQLVSSLKYVSNTLTHLTITRSRSIPSLPGQDEGFTVFAPPEPPLHVAGIMINCPNLETLDVGYRFDTDFKYVPPTKTWPKLTTLRLDHYDGITFNGQFLEILRRFPSLKTFSLNPCTETQYMTMIQRYCPSMRDLQLTTKLRRSPSRARNEQQHEDQWMNEGGGGLERISISEENNSYYVTWMDMCPMLKQHHNTLVHLHMNLSYGSIKDRELFNLEYPCLKTLILQGYSLPKAYFGWWIMRKAPFLEELSINADAIKSDPSILEFTPPPTLKKLEIDFFHVNHLDDRTVIGRFMHRFSQRKEGTTLKELKLCFDNRGDCTPDHFVASICHLNQLHHLTISYISRRTSWQIDDFLKVLVEGSPRLLSLDLDADITPSARTIKNLQNLPNLRHLGITMVETAEYDDSWDALGNLSQLHSIVIFSHSRVEGSFVRNLKRQRPGVKIVTTLRCSKTWYL